MHRFHDGVEDILEARQLRHHFLLRRGHDLVRRTLGHDASGVEHNHPLAQGKNLLSAVGDIENGNAVSPIPLPQVVDDLRLGRRVERGQRLVQKQHRGIDHQRSSQSHALALAAGNLPR